MDWSVRSDGCRQERREDEISLRRPDDWHLHVRDGDSLKAVIGFTAERFGRAIIMPNLKPPVTTVELATAYRNRIVESLPPTTGRRARFEPLMTLYLTDRTDPSEVNRAKTSGFIHGFKLYPAGATTNSTPASRASRTSTACSSA